MSLLFAGSPIDTVIFDFDQTLYPDDDPDLERNIFGDIKRNAAIHILAKRGKPRPTSDEIQEMRDMYDTRGMHDGWAVAFAQMGGDPEWFNQTARSAPKARYLQRDDELIKLFELLKDTVSVYIFSGSTHQSVADSLAVLTDGRQNEFVTDIIGDDDLPKGVEKPYPDAYRLFLDMKKINPERAIMLDDQPAEIRTILSFNMHGILVGARHTQTVRQTFPYHIERVHHLVDLITL